MPESQPIYPQHLTSEGLVRILSMFAQPQAQARITRDPIYFYGDPQSNTSGLMLSAPRRLLINPDADPDVGQTIRHESVHSVLEPYLSQLVKSRAASNLLPKIGAALAHYPEIYGDKPKLSDVYTEGLAYTNTGEPDIAGLSTKESQDFIKRILPLLKLGDQIKISRLASPPK